jgi:hypothetical protein
VWVVTQQIAVAAGNGFAARKDSVNARKLRQTQRALHFGEAVIETDFDVLEPRVCRFHGRVKGPRFGFVTAMVTQSRYAPRDLGVSCNNHAAFTRGDLFVGVEGENPGIAEGTNMAVADLRADRFAGIFDDEQVVTTRNVEKRSHRGRTAEGVNSNQGASAGRNDCFNVGRIEVPSLSVNVREDGLRANVADSIGDRNEGERRDDDLVARADSQGH